MYLLSIPMHTLMSTISLTWLYSLLKGSLGCFHWGLRWSRQAFQNGNYKSFVIASERRLWAMECKMVGQVWIMLRCFLFFFEHVEMHFWAFGYFDTFWIFLSYFGNSGTLWDSCERTTGNIVLDSNHTLKSQFWKNRIRSRCLFIEKPLFQRFDCSG